MEENKLEITEEMLENLSIEDIAELKVEVDDLVRRLDNILETCNEALNA